MYILSLDAIFASFLEPGATWLKRTTANPNRGLTDDPEAAIPRVMAAQKLYRLDLMLGQIANFCPIISRNRIIQDSVSLNDVWQAIRLHFGFHTTSARFIDLAYIEQRPEEKPEDLYQRILAAIEYNLLTQNGGITHHGQVIDVDEELTPTLENFVVLTWLRLLHKDLSALIRQRYRPELRRRSLASIKPEISQALPALLSELKLTQDVRSLSISQPHPGLLPRNGPPKGPLRGNRRNTRICPLCQQARRPRQDHLLSVCPFLPESDRRFMLRARTLGVEEDDNTDEYNFKDDDYYTHEDTTLEVFHTSVPERSRLSRVSVRRSPILNAISGNKTPVMILLDTGAECSFIRIEEAQRLGVRVDKNTSQRPSMADGLSSLRVLGETHINFLCHGNKLHMDAIVVDT